MNHCVVHLSRVFLEQEVVYVDIHQQLLETKAQLVEQKTQQEAVQDENGRVIHAQLEILEEAVVE